MVITNIEALKNIPNDLYRGIELLDRRVVIHSIKYKKDTDWCLILYSNTGRERLKKQIGRKRNFNTRILSDPQYAIMRNVDDYVNTESFPLKVNNWLIEDIKLLEEDLHTILKKRGRKKEINLGTNRDLSWLRLKEYLEERK